MNKADETYRLIKAIADCMVLFPDLPGHIDKAIAVRAELEAFFRSFPTEDKTYFVTHLMQQGIPENDAVEDIDYLLGARAEA